MYSCIYVYVCVCVCVLHTHIIGWLSRFKLIAFGD
jgi:hypothetical protein